MYKTNAYTEGDPNSKIAFVAEAPARVEEMRNRPLVGESGVVWDTLLQAAGISRSEAYTINCVKHRISDTSKFMTNSGLTTEGMKVKEDVKERLKDCKANVFVPMGKLATCILTGNTEITKFRGSILESTLLPGRKVIPTYHPAYTLMRRGPANYLFRYDIVADLKKAKRHMEFPEVPSPTLEAILDPTFNQIIEFIDMVDRDPSMDIFGYDIECYNNQISCLAIAPHKDLALCIPFVNRWNEPQEGQIWLALCRLMKNESVTKVMHNFLFDVSYTWHQSKILTRGPVECTMTAYRTIYPDMRSGLDHLVSIYTDHPYYKDDRKLWRTPARDPMAFWLYNCRDSAYTIEVWDKVKEELEADPEYLTMYKADMELTDPLLWMMTAGIPINVEKLSVMRDQVVEELAETVEELHKVAQEPFNPGSSKQVIKYFYETLKVKPYLNRGRPTCDDKALSRIARRDSLPEARILQKWRHLDKLRSTYLELVYDPDKRLRCFYQLKGTKSARLSSTKTLKGTGLNMQNLDPAFKKFLYCEEEEK